MMGLAGLVSTNGKIKNNKNANKAPQIQARTDAKASTGSEASGPKFDEG